MIREIISELWYVFILAMIIFYGLMCMDISNRMSMHDYCQNWEYNLTPDEGSGFYDAMVDPNKKVKIRMPKS